MREHMLPATAGLGTVVLSVLLAWSLVTGQSVIKSAGGAVTKFDAVTVGEPTGDEFYLWPCTTSLSYVDMPGVVKTFRLRGTASDEVVVLFSAVLGGDASLTRIRLLIDGAVQSGPGADGFEFQLATTPGLAAFNFLSDLLAPGQHTAKIQWRSAVAGRVCTHARSMVVLHR